jgi:DNA recombination protein RmuC
MDASFLPYLASAVVTAVVVTALIMLRLQRGKPVEEPTGPNPVEQQLVQLADMQNQLAGRLATLQEGQTTSQQTLNQALNERLDAVSQRLNQSLTESTQKTNQTLNERLEKVSKNLTETSLKNREQLGEQLGMLNTRLAVIGEAQKKLDSLTTEVVGLQEVLGNKQARGAFGEIQLNDIVVSALPPSAYSFQSTLSNGKRADCLIKLPNPPGSIVIDSKFPLDSYRRLVDATDDEAKKQASRQLRADVTKHIKDISGRYIIPGETAESALMFLPSEAVYAELHARFSDVVDQGYRARVWIVSPTTLMATLNTVRAVLKDAQIREQAHVIQAEVNKLLKDVHLLEKRVDSLKRHFGQAENDIREIEISTKKIVKKGDQIEKVEVEGTIELSPPSETAVKSRNQPDLLTGE